MTDALGGAGGAGALTGDEQAALNQLQQILKQAEVMAIETSKISTRENAIRKTNESANVR